MANIIEKDGCILGFRCDLHRYFSKIKSDYEFFGEDAVPEGEKAIWMLDALERLTTDDWEFIYIKELPNETVEFKRVELEEDDYDDGEGD